RSLGLPARVVTGAALSGGSFGAHPRGAIYLGEWGEPDPAWGVVNHRDATPPRLGGDALRSYAMLHHLHPEMHPARPAPAPYQRDRIRLVKEFSLRPATRDLAFDLSLTAEQALGPDGWNKLDEKQRAAVITAFEKTVNGMWETWDAENQLPPRILQSDINS